MYRAIIVASLVAVASMPSRAAEMCIVCEQPAATYRCSVELPSDKYNIAPLLQAEMCAKVLAKKGEHHKCALLPVAEGGKCEGFARTVTVTDYQRALTPAGEETYEIGALEKVQRNMQDTWLCVTSMFKDC
ncbi:MAG: hypothetical protein Q8L61_01450 [Hyphomicrobium sp.]|nr:hypothetical protein [Hyphomicrobium sp.]